MSQKFRDDYGVYICSHVFENNAPVLEGIRDPDGFWQFFCGQDHDFDNEEPHLVGVGHLTSKDESIHELTKLNIGEFAERKTEHNVWQFGKIEE